MTQCLQLRLPTIVVLCLFLCGCKPAPPPVSHPAVADDEPHPYDIANSIGMKLKLIPSGKFLMGSPKDEKGRSEDEGPQHEVEITRPFYMGIYPVTKGQFAAFINEDGYETEAEQSDAKHTWQAPGFFLKYDQTDSDPVVCMSWNDAVKFCEWLSKKEGKIYRLPTEAEWEYACRAGTTTPYYFGNDSDSLRDYAIDLGSSDPHTHPVGEKEPNPWGLYDMLGNSVQWCGDYYDPDYYRKSPKKDPENLDPTYIRALRGGSFSSFSRECRSAYRFRHKTDNGTFGFGFRVVLARD